ncbi:hemin uptake protein HemP [Noviherbaspirillum cavernae]|uniref:Hemin uptake protein HemP n=1 Tax=Noviherbaspirillum cavernae TaxID=2320862 RepID=A0A418X6M2_9BURK|nr:hemin uptake protein HemP [Noviherbaspirillum cavernae]
MEAQCEAAAAPHEAVAAASPLIRIKSEELLQRSREIEIDHHGRIYRLRVTQLNKLILTA